MFVECFQSKCLQNIVNKYYLNILCILFTTHFMVNVQETFPAYPSFPELFYNGKNTFPIKPQFLELFYKHLIYVFCKKHL